MITLYLNWNAVCAQKVVLCLTEKRIPYNIRHLDLASFEQHQPWYLALNPAGVVPTLVENETVLTESTVINEYLEDAYPETRLRPVAPAARARMRWWAKQVDDVVHPSIRPISFTRFATARAQAMGAEERAAMRARTPKKEIADLWTRVAEAPFTAAELGDYLHKIVDVLTRMETTLQRDPWLAGEEYSLADIAMTPYFGRLEQLDKTALWEGLPATTAWLARIRARPSHAALADLKARYAAA